MKNKALMWSKLCCWFRIRKQ